MICLLCGSSSVLHFETDKFRDYHQCQDCLLVFVPREQLVGPEIEKQHYDLHENSEQDPRYREYLSKITKSVLPFLPEAARGLDFGCGESILLEKIFDKDGHQVDSFDLYYRVEEKIWDRTYHFIVLSEVIEHLREPLETMQRLRKLLGPRGQMFIKTKYLPGEKVAFKNWYYKRDPTHVQFFNQRSLQTLASQLGLAGPVNLDCPDLVRLWA